MRQLSKADYDRVAEIHIQNITSGFLSTLGVPFLSLLYRVIDEDGQSVLIVARDEERIIGFVAGALCGMRPIYLGLLRRAPRLAWSLAPVLLSFKKMHRIVEIMQYGSKSTNSGQKTVPAAELLSLALDAQFRGTGRAEDLYKALCSALLKQGVDSFRIVVGQDLHPAHRFYNRMGAIEIGRIQLHAGESSTLYVQKCSD